MAVGVDEYDALVGWASGERLLGLLMAALEGGSVIVGTTNTDRLASLERTADVHRAALRSSLAAEATVVSAIRTLRRVGIEGYVFKGAATAHLDYCDPAMRTFFDADVHVKREDFEQAIVVLTAQGYRASSNVMSRRWQHRFARASEMRSLDGVELDLHAAVATGYFGVQLDHNRLRVAGDHLVLCGVDIPAFSAPARALISCYGVVLSRGPGLRLQRDLAQQLGRLGDRWPEMLAFAGDDGAVVIAAAIDLVGATLGRTLGDAAFREWSATVAPGRRSRRALELAEAGLLTGWSADARSTMLALRPLDRARFGIGVGASKLRRRH